MAGSKPLLIGVSARIYFPGQHGELPGVFTKTLHYLEQSVAHWVLGGHAMAVMIPAVTKDSIVLRSGWLKAFGASGVPAGTARPRQA